MSETINMSRKTRINWLINISVFIGAFLALISGVYFLFFPSGGYQGGRNASYGVTILFDRSTWDLLHTWGGIVMIAAVAFHFSIHWKWVAMIGRRVLKGLRGQGSGLSKGGKLNLVIDMVIALSFFTAAITGMYFLFLTDGGYQDGRNAGWDPGFLFSRTTWDLIHTWSGIAMAIAAMTHIYIHWRWITKVSKRFFLPVKNMDAQDSRIFSGNRAQAR